LRIHFFASFKDPEDPQKTSLGAILGVSKKGETMFQIFDSEGEHIRWTPRGFATRADALAWIAKHTTQCEGEPMFRIGESLDEEYAEFTYYNERHF
jgi:hypothetical protein